MSRVLAIIVGDVAVGLWLLLSVARQKRNRERVLTVGSCLLMCALILAVVTRAHR